MTELTSDTGLTGYDRTLLRRLLRRLRPYRWQAVLAVLLLLVSAALALVGPVLTQRMLDVAVPLPSWPNRLRPAHFTPPSLAMQMW